MYQVGKKRSTRKNWSRGRGLVIGLVLMTAGCSGFDLAGLIGQLQPSVTTVSPGAGASAGGTEVLIVGEHFREDSNVQFGGQDVEQVTFVSATLLEVITPAHAPGMVDVAILDSHGMAMVTSDAFEYLPEEPAGHPVMAATSITPVSGLTTGGTSVTIYGIGFEEGMSVLFGPLPGTAVSFISGQILTVVTPSQGAGTVDVILINSIGESVVLPAAFEYAAPPPTTVGVLSPASGPSSGGTTVTLQGSSFKPGTIVLFGGFLGIDTQVVSSQAMISVTPAYASGVVDVVILPPAGEPAVVLPASFEFLPTVPESSTDLARVVGAVSQGNTTVLVTFSEPMGEGADDPLLYDIREQDTSQLIVTAAELLSTLTQVRLTTLSQDAVDYTLHVIGVKDAFGRPMAAPDNVLAPPQGEDPSRAIFRGTAPSGDEIYVDSDGDGLADYLESKGWIVTVTYINGTSSTKDVTSNPMEPDTDLDGMNDLTEFAYSLDPRTHDTDADLLDDDTEWYDYRSDPTHQDTDFDGFGEDLEVNFFHTSPILADTDGDSWSDTEEVLIRNRNPRLSDLPIPGVTTGTITVMLNETFSWTDENGNEVNDTSSHTASLTESESATAGTTDTRTTLNTIEHNATAGVTATTTIGGKAAWEGLELEVSAEYAYTNTDQRGHNFEVSESSSQETQNAYQDEVSQGLTTSERQTVTRTADSGTVLADVTYHNYGDVAFTISNVELVVLKADRYDRTKYLPITTLARDGVESVNLGPLDSQKGPFIFNNKELFPNLIQDLLKEPKNLIFEVANFDIVDEFGRNFAFSSQDVVERTALIIIDYDNGTVERFHVATASTFDNLGLTRGITLGEALADIVGITRSPGDDEPLPPGTELLDPDTLDPSIGDTYGVVPDVDGYEVLTRVRGVQSTQLPSAEPKFWTISANEALSAQVHFADRVVKPGDVISLLYVQDIDGDGAIARVEALHGSSDIDLDGDSDNDGLGDFEEIFNGWTVDIPGFGYKTYPSPARSDSDKDGVADLDERTAETDPNNADTDGDGLGDALELTGFDVNGEPFTIELFNLTPDPDDARQITLEPYISVAIVDGGNGSVDTAVAAESDDVALGDVGFAVLPGRRIITPGANHTLETLLTNVAADGIPVKGGDDLYLAIETVVAGFDGEADSQTTGDDVQIHPPGTAGLATGEVIIESGPNGVIDTLVPDYSPFDPAPANDDLVFGAHYRFYATDPLSVNTDGDEELDGREVLFGSLPNNPRDGILLKDTDEDGLLDAEEEAGWDTVDPADPDKTLHVTSSKFLPDTDGDGMFDVWEWGIASNPQLDDTDGDGLDELEEYDPADVAGRYDADGLAEAALRCGIAAQCFYPAPPAVLGTDVLKDDTDGDGRSDGDEVNVPWTVSVHDAQPYEIKSNPLDDDEDLDSLTDGEELAVGTDPTLFDTDGDENDAKSDKYEIDVGRDPLWEDKVVTFEYTSMLITGDCDPGESGSAFYGTLYLDDPTGQSQLVIHTCAEGENCGGGLCDGVEEGSTCYFSWSDTFVLNTAQVFTASSNTISECDDNCDDSGGGNDETLSSFNQDLSFGYWESSTTAEWSVSDSDDPAGCVVTIYASITTD